MRFQGVDISVEDGDTVLDALERAGVAVKRGCGVGSCQSCLVRGSEPPARSQAGLDAEVAEAGGFLACRAPAENVGDVGPIDDLYPKFEARLCEKRWLSKTILYLSFAVPELRLEPGRFVRLSSGGIERAYSIANHAADLAHLNLHVRILPEGAMSQRICLAETGDLFHVRGPFGKCRYVPEKRDQALLFIGSGTGLAPLYSVATAALENRHEAPIRIYLGAATPDGLYFQQEISELQGVEVHFCVDEDATGATRIGSPLDIALADHPNLERQVVYLCGHPGLVRAAQKQCFMAGARLSEIFTDPFEPSG